MVADVFKARLAWFNATTGAYIKATCVTDVNGPIDFAFTPHGETVVVDYNTSVVRCFGASSDTLRKCFGGYGSDSGQLTLPTAIAVCGTRLYVIEHNGKRVQVFS